MTPPRTRRDQICREWQQMCRLAGIRSMRANETAARP